MIQFANGKISPLYSGRNNLALTIMCPSDCQNACRFCISKKEYAHNKPNKDLVLKTISDFFNNRSIVRDVVFTGGEPMNDMDFLRKAIDFIPDTVNVYINTSFIERNIEEFISFVNDTPKIKGVNISRHTGSYVNDCKILCDIAPDEKIREFTKPVRINCVIGEDIAMIDNVVNRWKIFDNVEISFRADFTKLTTKELHIPFCRVNNYLASKFEYVGNTQCNVCDTTIFKAETGMFVKYHRGLQATAIKGIFGIEVNDFVLRQDGKLFIDWDFNDSNEVIITTTYSAIPPYSCGCHTLSIDDMPIHSCGGGGYGCGGYIRHYGGCGGSGC